MIRSQRNSGVRWRRQVHFNGFVEYILAVEDAFEVAIPDEDAAQLESPQRLAEYLTTRLIHADDGPPLLQTVFYRLRTAIADELSIERQRIRPSTTLEELVGSRTVDEVWPAIAARLGLRTKDLTHAPRERWIAKLKRAPARSLGHVSKQLAMMRPAALKPKNVGWTQSQIAEVVIRLLEQQIGVDVRKYGIDATFVRDLGMG